MPTPEKPIIEAIRAERRSGDGRAKFYGGNPDELETTGSGDPSPIDYIPVPGRRMEDD